MSVNKKKEEDKIRRIHRENQQNRENSIMISARGNKTFFGQIVFTNHKSQTDLIAACFYQFREHLKMFFFSILSQTLFFKVGISI